MALCPYWFFFSPSSGLHFSFQFPFLENFMFSITFLSSVHENSPRTIIGPIFPACLWPIQLALLWDHCRHWQRRPWDALRWSICLWPPVSGRSRCLGCLSVSTSTSLVDPASSHCRQLASPPATFYPWWYRPAPWVAVFQVSTCSQFWPHSKAEISVNIIFLMKVCKWAYRFFIRCSVGK